MSADASTMRRHRRMAAGGAIAVVVAIVGVLVFWGITAPPLANVDEPRHFNSVLRLMQQGGWPPPHTAELTEGTLVAMQEAGHPLRGISRITPPAAADRTVVTELTALEYQGVSGEDWMNQHPPTYYGLVAGVLAILGGQDWRWDQQLMAMRLLSIAFVAGGIVFAMAAIRRLTGWAPAALVGMLWVLGVPQFFNVLGLVTNDSLAFLATSGFLFFLARAWLTPPGRVRRLTSESAGAGALLGLGLLTKGTLLAAIPVVLLTLLVCGLRQRWAWWQRLLPAAVSMVVAFVVGGWWYVRNLLVYGEIQASTGGTGRVPVAHDGYSFSSFLVRASRRMIETFWGSRRATLDFSGWVVIALLILTLAALLLVLVFSERRLFVALQLVLPLCIVGLISFHAWEVYWNELKIVGMQGRYLFGGIMLYGLLFALAWRWIASHLAPTARVVAAALAGGLPVAVGAWGAVFAFRVRWAGLSTGSWTAAADAGPFPVGLIVVVVVVATLAVLTALVCAGVTAAAPRALAHAGRES